MPISKTSFINAMRCSRYVALNEIYNDKSDAIVSFTANIDEEDLMSLENKNKRLDLQNSMYDENTNNDLLKEIDPQLQMMNPYFNYLEILSGRAIKNKYGGNVVYDLDTFNQKRFSYHYEGFEFLCYLDGYQEDDKKVRIFETKATTSSKYSEDNFYYKKPLDKTKYPMFTKLPSGVYVPTEDVKEVPDQYYKKEAKLFDRLNALGAYIYDLAFQRYVFEKTYNKKKEVEYYLVVLNHEYIHSGAKDSNNKPVYTDEIVRFYNLTSLTKKMMKIIKSDTDILIKRLNRMDARPTNVGKHCMRGKNKECIFYDICHKDIPKDNSIFIYDQSHHGFKEKDGRKHELYDLVNEGYTKALDVKEEWLNRYNNVIQRRVIESGKPHYNKEKIRDGIKALKYPIYHLDFESFNAPLPRYKGETPYTQSLFQFSIHIEGKPGVCHKDNDHYEYLARDHKDNRFALLEAMLDIIKDDDGSILVYNESFEKTRLKELQQYFPKYYDRIQNIIDRIFDLMYIVKTNSKFYEKLGYDKDEAKEFNFYHSKLNGSFSIKKVLPIFSGISYQGMRVGDGIEAMIAYSKIEELDGIEKEETTTDLINYCKQDTWAMVEILNELRKI